MIRRIGLALALLAGTPALLTAQYFGQNKVNYRALKFQVIQTEHFDIYFYDEERTAAMDAGRMAERAYARLSRILNHRYIERKPLILYASHSDFQQTNALGGEAPSEGTGGVTEFFRQRIVLPFTGSYADLEHVLQHEMVHQFQYDIYSRGRAGAGIQTLIAVNPPGWFMEGMAEYLSRGPVDPETAMWLRDAALEGTLPTIQQLNSGRVFPYRFGHAIWAYIGERWGDEAIGAILHGTLNGGLEGAFRRTLGVNFQQLSNEWRDAVQRQYLPQVTNHDKARVFSGALLTKDKSQGTYHLAPAFSPDGSQVAFFSERNFYFVDLYLADGLSGQVKRRLLKSTFSGSYETYRFINSSSGFSPDGRYLVVAAKRGPRDDVVIIDAHNGKESKRISLPLNGVTTPSFSPDGKQIVFTGYEGGLSDLYIVNRDGAGLRRLTQDKYADLHPTWSPDGKSIAFATDRGPGTDFRTLAFGNMRLALYHLDDGRVELLDHMDQGRNTSPQWSPDGRQIAFVSDRTGVSDIFLYDLEQREIYRITRMYTGAQGIVPLAPVLSWAREADRLAFVYFEKGDYDVYAISDPRSLRREPYRDVPDDMLAPSGALVAVAPPPTDSGPGVRRDSVPVNPAASGGSLYRTSGGFRAADQTPSADSSAPKPISVAALLDSASLSLPDTAEFTLKPYKVKFSPDYVARPVVGYTRDNFGGGFYGGTTVILSDILGDHILVFSGYINGRPQEADVIAQYANLSRRLNWAVGLSQTPYYFFEPSEIIPNSPTPGENTLVTNLRRIVLRTASAEAYYPLSRSRRIEMGLRLANVDDGILSIREPYDPSTGFATRDPSQGETNLPSVNYAEPNLAYVYDNTLFGYVGPFYGRRYRFEVAQAVGGWNFTQLLGDYRRYDKVVGPFTLATRALYFGRIGASADQFKIFLGRTDLVRGYTSGSFLRNECFTSTVRCTAFDRLVGEQIAVGSAELRFPILNPSMGFVPQGFPPIEGAVFYDAGIAWDRGNTLKWSRDPGDSPLDVRTPLQAWGLAARMNVFGLMILRVDYSRPINRPAVGHLWTVSLGPTF